MKNPRTVKVTYDPLSELLQRRRKDNPKMHDERSIDASIGRVGFIDPPIVNDADDKLIAGHGRVDVLAALQGAGAPPPDGIHCDAEGEWLVPTLHGVELGADDARAFLIADNRTVELGGWDDKLLAQALLELSEAEGSLEGVGFSSQDLDEIVSGLLASVDRQAVGPDDLPPEEGEEPRVRPGECYRLGVHTVACADSRTSGLMNELLAGTQATGVVTDPPYGVGYRGKGATRLSIKGDEAEGLEGLLAETFANVDCALSPGAAIYVFHPAGPLSLTFAHAILEQGWTYRQSLVWNKGAAVLGRSDYQYAHEPILYASKPGRRLRNGKPAKSWFGGRDASSVIDCPRPRASREHPTMKPVALIEVLLKNSTERGDTFLDPFLGSGSCLIAAERLGRRCVGVEIDPLYAEGAIRRWERFTGLTAQLVSEGMS